MNRVDRRSLAKAAAELEERYQSSFQERGGRLNVDAGTASNLRTRTKSIELLASVEWDGSRIYEHAHAEVARRSWFSRRWETVRSPETAIEEIRARLAAWLSAGS